MKITVVGMAAALLAAGCANQQQQGIAEGAGLGAVAGALLCALAKGDRDTCIAVAAAGAVTGGALAHNYAQSVQERRAMLRGQENDVDARLAYMRGVNEDSVRFNDQLKKQLATETETIDRMSRQAAAGRLPDREREAGRARLNKDVAALETQLAAMEAQSRDMKQFRAQAANSSDKAALRQIDTEIAQLERTLAEARQNTTALASISRRI